jgi:hypothetical protein
MNVIDIEKLNQLISRTDISGNDKVKWLTDFIDGREPQQQNRMYSEEYIRIMLRELSSDLYEIDPLHSLEEWFEQFKKGGQDD